MNPFKIVSNSKTDQWDWVFKWTFQECKQFLQNSRANKYLDTRFWEIEENLEEIIEERKTRTYTQCFCSSCGSQFRVNRMFFSKLHLQILLKVFDHCIKQRSHVFHTRDIDLKHSEYANIAWLRKFGIIYSIDSWTDAWKYGMPMKRVYDFLQWKWQVAQYVESNTARKTHHVSEERIFIDQIMKSDHILWENLIPYFVEYDKCSDIF